MRIPNQSKDADIRIAGSPKVVKQTALTGGLQDNLWCELQSDDDPGVATSWVPNLHNIWKLLEKRKWWDAT